MKKSLFPACSSSMADNTQLLELPNIGIGGIDRNLASTFEFGNEFLVEEFSQTLGGHDVYDDFPSFDGSNPRIWIMECDNYLQIQPYISDIKKIDLAIWNFEGKAFSWVSELLIDEILAMNWKQFCEVVCSRFEMLKVSNDDSRIESVDSVALPLPGDSRNEVILVRSEYDEPKLKAKDIASLFDIRDWIATLGNLRFRVLDSAGLEAEASSGSLLGRTTTITRYVLRCDVTPLFLGIETLRGVPRIEVTFDMDANGMAAVKQLEGLGSVLTCWDPGDSIVVANSSLSEIINLESVSYAVASAYLKVVLAAETRGGLGGMVKQLPIDKFENEGRRVSYGTPESATAAKKLLDRQISINGVHKKVIAHLLKPRGWKPPVRIQFFLDCDEIADLCDSVERIFVSESSVLQLKIPPRSMFIVQRLGTVIAGTINISVAWWLLTSITNICQDDLFPPDSPWTCPGDRVLFDPSVIWGLVGPKRIFGSLGNYSSMNWFYLGGALGPVVVWLFYKAFPKQTWIPLMNMPDLLGAPGMMPPATPLNYNAWIIFGTIFNCFVLRYRKSWWQRYNYILSAALDAGVAFMAVAIYFSLSIDDRGIDWWGTSGEQSQGSCFTFLHQILIEKYKALVYVRCELIGSTLEKLQWQHLSTIMKAIADAHSNRSLNFFEIALQNFMTEWDEDPIVHRHLSALYYTLHEQNLCRLIEPFPRVGIAHIAELIELPSHQVEKILFQMILDKKVARTVACSFLKEKMKRGNLYRTKDLVSKGAYWIVNEMKSELRGRVGGGISSGLKWSFMPKTSSGRPSYLVVNADESESGTCTGGEIMRHDPHKPLEYCLIARVEMRAIAAYICGEYVNDRLNLENARNEANAAGLLGNGSLVQALLENVAVIGFICICLMLFLAWGLMVKRQRGKAERKKIFEASQVFSWDSTGIVLKEESEVDNIVKLSSFTFDMIANATENFNEQNLFGRGGFGPIYKGILGDGKEITMKRLSTASRHGAQEFKNKLIVISKIYHRNLVRLLGYCVENKGKTLIYEYMPNKSLVVLLFDSFDPSKRAVDRRKRFNIIEGIGCDLLYLHRTSRLRIIHRYFTPSNVLLDEKYSGCKFSTFDPWGQGSSSGGGIVMAHEGGEKKLMEEELGKLDLWILLNLVMEELKMATENRVGQFKEKMSWAVKDEVHWVIEIMF